MASTGRFWIACLLGVAFWGSCAKTQTLPAAPATPDDALRAMTALAGVIFTGQVVAVKKHDPANGSAGVVEVQFAVEDAVRGVSGASYTLREWAGLWPGGNEPFRVGQRYLMLLHTPSAAGLSSPVGGMDGAIPIRGAATRGTQVVDLNWVATRVVQPTVYVATASQGPTGGPILATASAKLASNPATAKVADANAPIEGVSASAQMVPYSTVLGMLRGWESGDNGAR